MTIRVEIEEINRVMNLTSGRTVESCINSAALLSPKKFLYPSINDIRVNGEPANWNDTLIDGDELTISSSELDSIDNVLENILGPEDNSDDHVCTIDDIRASEEIIDNESPELSLGISESNSSGPKLEDELFRELNEMMGSVTDFSEELFNYINKIDALIKGRMN